MWPNRRELANDRCGWFSCHWITIYARNRALVVWDGDFEKIEQGPQSHLFRNNRLPSNFNVEVEIEDRYQLHKHLYFVVKNIHGFHTHLP
jgi:hypothetical protein